MLANYREALTFHLQPNSRIKHWHLYLVTILGYGVIPLVSLLKLSILGVVPLSISITITGALLRKWGHYLRGNELAAETAIWHMFWTIIAGWFGLALGVSTYVHQPQLSERDFFNAMAISGVLALISIVIFVSGAKRLAKLQKTTIKNIPKKELFQ